MDVALALVFLVVILAVVAGSAWARRTEMKAADRPATLFLALTPKGARDVAEVALSAGASLWVGADGLSDAQYTHPGKRGLAISRFENALASADPEAIAEAVSTVIQRHPNATL